MAGNVRFDIRRVGARCLTDARAAGACVVWQLQAKEYGSRVFSRR
jgi:hypothetical protein